MRTLLLADLAVQALMCGTLWQYVTRWYVWSDAVCLLPWILQTAVGEVRGKIEMLKMMRLLRVLRTYRMLSRAERGTLHREVWLLIYTLTIVVLIAAGVFHAVEPATFRTFHDGIYFVVVTITTVGYGDLSPV